jgi:hypothetical protein
MFVVLELYPSVTIQEGNLAEEKAEGVDPRQEHSGYNLLYTILPEP